MPMHDALSRFCSLDTMIYCYRFQQWIFDQS